MGQWMDRNSDSIYGPSPTPFKNGPGFNGEVTVKDRRLYLHVFGWPKNGRLTLCVGKGCTGTIEHDVAGPAKQERESVSEQP